MKYTQFIRVKQIAFAGLAVLCVLRSVLAAPWSARGSSGRSAANSLFDPFYRHACQASYGSPVSYTDVSYLRDSLR